jgi:hypothetical protein
MSKPRKHDGVVYSRKDGRSGGFDIGTEMEKPVESPATPRTGKKPTGNFVKGFKPGMATS